MADLSSVSGGFFGYDAVFELVFALITLAVAFYSFKIYKLSDQKKSRIFGIAFLFISSSYFIQSLFNTSIFFELNEKFISLIEINNLLTINILSIFLHMVFFTVGIVTLIYMIAGGKNRFLYVISLIVILLSLFMSANKIYFFYILSSLLLIFIVAHYVTNYLEHKDNKSLTVLAAFLFLLVGHIQYIFISSNTLYYVLGHILELVAYSLILINLVRIIKK